MMDVPNLPDALGPIARLSARVGADPLLVQGAGGNTSIKDRDVMWIKASGTLLANAETENIFVPCDLVAMRDAIAQGDARADKAQDFLIGPVRLRPSIETSLHSVFRHAVVVHVHCVNTIALAIRADARDVLATHLADFDWSFVPYAKPGAPLARSVVASLGPRTNVVVLGNHGLIIAAPSVAEAEQLLDQVVAAVTTAPRMSAVDMDGIHRRAGDGFAPLPPDHPLHGVAIDKDRLGFALGGSLYPDHVLFCGVGSTAMLPDESPAQAVERSVLMGYPAPPFLLVPGKGALQRSDASAGAQALSRCLGDVLARVPTGARLTYLNYAQNGELLDWDAEKYRAALDAAR